MKIKTVYLSKPRKTQSASGRRTHLTVEGKGGVESIELCTIDGVSGVLVMPNAEEKGRSPTFIVDFTHVEFFPFEECEEEEWEEEEEEAVDATPANLPGDENPYVNTPTPSDNPEPTVPVPTDNPGDADTSGTPADDGEDPEEKAEEPREPTVKELRKTAAKLGISSDKLRKPELIEAIKKAQS